MRGFLLWRSLAGRLLLATLGFVMVAQALVFAPALAQARADFLRKKLDAAWLVSYATDQGKPLSQGFEDALLDAAGVEMAMQRLESGARALSLRRDVEEPPRVVVLALDEETFPQQIWRALLALVHTPKALLHVTGHPRKDNPVFVEILLKPESLTVELRDFALRMLWAALGISVFVALLVFQTLNRLLVRPVRRLAEGMTAFREDPQGAPAFVASSADGAELEAAGRALAAMQTDLKAALKQKSHLADLGEAVAKISHDLRNTLASAQILADRFEQSEDPLVRRAAPKLVRSLDRATDLCAQTLRYGKAAEPPPERRRIALGSFLPDVVSVAAPPEDKNVRCQIDVAPEAIAEADPDQLYRIMLNLIRNAAQALESSGGGLIRVAAAREREGVNIDVADDGPGLLAEARATLFKPFRSGRRGGTGLGLAIAQELAQAHGGSVSLIDSDKGAHFRVWIPDKGGRTS